jgi:hypothetical protein
MTALSRYARLEATGLWRPGPEAQRREVLVVLGKATLVLSDGRNETALSHWSLAAIRRLDPGGRPALFAPGDDGSGESLEIDDPQMIEAIEAVGRAIDRRRARPGRLRIGIFALGVVAVAAVVFLWLPGALVGHAARILPEVKRTEIGGAILEDAKRLTGAPCTSAEGKRALERLSERLFGAEGPTIIILREGLERAGGALHLPGGIIALDRRLVENEDTPDVAAGFALAEGLRSVAADPLPLVLRHAGVGATLRLLTTGNLPEDALSGVAEDLLATPPATLDPGVIAAGFDAVGLRAAPYGRAIDPEGAAGIAEAMAAADRAATSPARLVLSDTDWVALQGICGG